MSQTTKKVKSKKTVRFTEVFHFPSDDPDCISDYTDIELQDESGQTIATFGSYYDDKGEDRVLGFVQGVEYALGVKVKLSKKQLADR